MLRLSGVLCTLLIVLIAFGRLSKARDLEIVELMEIRGGDIRPACYCYPNPLCNPSNTMPCGSQPMGSCATHHYQVQQAGNKNECISTGESTIYTCEEWNDQGGPHTCLVKYNCYWDLVICKDTGPTNEPNWDHCNTY